MAFSVMFGSPHDKRFVYAFDTADDLKTFFANRPSLREFRLSYLYVRGDTPISLFPVIADHCPLLKRISLKHGLFHWSEITSLEGMVKLEVQGHGGDKLPTPPEDWLRTLCTLCTRNLTLQSIDIFDSIGGRIDLEGFATIATLRRLRRTGTFPKMAKGSSLADENRIAQELIANSGPSLRMLDIWPVRLTRESVELMAETCARLREVVICIEDDVKPPLVSALIGLITRSPKWKAGRDRLTMLVLLSNRNQPDGAPNEFRQRVYVPQGVQLTVKFRGHT